MNVGLLFCMATRVYDIYTASAYYNPPSNNGSILTLHPFDRLSDNYREWIVENSIKMMENPTSAESEFEHQLLMNNIPFEKQVFFLINNHCYFLDFYLYKQNVAIEIDGGIHKAQKEYDNYRDKDFKTIGIKTIRIPNESVGNPEIIEKINNAIYNLRYSNRYVKSIKLFESNLYADRHKFDSQIDLTQWHHVDENPKIHKKYLVLYEQHQKLHLSLCEFNPESGYWQFLESGLSVNRIRYWYELPKNPLTPRIYARDE